LESEQAQCRHCGLVRRTRLVVQIAGMRFVVEYKGHAEWFESHNGAPPCTTNIAKSIEDARKRLA
jgi:hypothetical protein